MKRFCKTLRKLLHNKLAAAGIVICLAMMIIAIFAPFVAPHDPNYQPFPIFCKNPAPNTPWARTILGRCVYSRVIYGTRITIVVGVVAVLIAMTLGTTLGLLAGYYKGRIDTVISSITDAVWSFPTIILALPSQRLWGRD